MESSQQSFPVAMDAPQADVVILDQHLMERAIAQSRQSPRKRIIFPLHKSDDATLHRMFNVAQPGTYIRPHWHRDPPKDETLVVIRGALAVLIFSDDGDIRQTIKLKAGTSQFGVDLVAGVCHTFICLESDTVVFEVKSGPYHKATDKDFASWVPAEYTPEALQLLKKWEAAVQSC